MKSIKLYLQEIHVIHSVRRKAASFLKAHSKNYVQETINIEDEDELIRTFQLR